MGTSFRHIEHSTVVRTEIGPVPGAVGRRRHSKIDDDVENRPSSTANELCLERRGDLIVQSANRASPMAKGHIGLKRNEVDGPLREFEIAPGAHESAARILMRSGFDNPCTLNVTLREFHTEWARRGPAKRLAKSPGASPRASDNTWELFSQDRAGAARCLRSVDFVRLISFPRSVPIARDRVLLHPARCDTGDTNRRPAESHRRSSVGFANQERWPSW